mmetsp:Transcript_4928/g.10884  ORF Transcript_4928/g.10884 Transcript_4928/m.10884 type:complete len:274 (-) Transcript_4928:99-920(-)
MNVEASDAHPLKLRGFLAVGEGEFEVVVQVEFVLLEAGVTGGSLEAHGISADGVVELLAAHQDGKLIDGDVDAVLTVHEFAKPAEFLSAHLHDAEGGAFFADLGGEGVGCHLKLVSHQTASQITALAEPLLDLLGWFRARGKIVKFEGELGLFAFHEIDEGGDGFAVAVFFWGGAWEKDLGQGGFLSLQQSLALFFAEFVGAQFGRLLGHTDLVLPRGFHVGEFHRLLFRFRLALFAVGLRALKSLFVSIFVSLFVSLFVSGLDDIEGGGEER